VTEQDLVVIRILYLGGFFGTLFFLLLWEEGEPLRPFADTRARRQHRWRNLAMLFWVVVIADYVFGQWLFHAESFLFEPPLRLLDGLSWPLPMQVAAGLLASDLVDYLLHVASHRWNWLWRLHAVHHSDIHLDVTTAGRFHPLETTLSLMAKLGLYMALGLPFWIEGVRAILHNSVLFIQHANVAYPKAIERLGWLFATPAIHRVHHDLDPRLRDSNYGQIFSFWDRLLGTFTAPGVSTGRRVGLAGVDGERWQTVRGMLAMPFLSRSGPDQGL
jgi:sterol desaturase/sphingolipid hydroxylase (fatty acid hydroxylase superfamily)